MDWPLLVYLTCYNSIPPPQGLCIPKVHTKKYGERTFAYAAPKLYKLPVSLRQSATLNAFKAGLKMHLFKLAYEAEF